MEVRRTWGRAPATYEEITTIEVVSMETRNFSVQVEIKQRWSNKRNARNVLLSLTAAEAKELGQQLLDAAEDASDAAA